MFKSIQSIVSANAEVSKGAHARMTSFVGAIAIADLVKTTLGPKGMDKILQSVIFDVVSLSISRHNSPLFRFLIQTT